MRGMRTLPLIGLLLCALAGMGGAQDYPSKIVRIVVPFPPGAINDTIGRILANQLGARLGKQFIVDNRAGAGGIIAYELVANAPKDGHTLLVVSSAMAVAPWMHKLPYDSVKAFAPIAILATAPAVVAAGVGTFLHLAGELFKLTAGVDILHIPFKGAGPAMTDVIGGHTQLVFASIGSTIAHLRSGKLKALGVGASQRNRLLPDVPTVAESGLPGYTAANWFGIVAPAGTPPAIIARLHHEISEIQNSPEMQKQFANDGADIMRMSSAEFSAFIESELENWGRVVKEAGIKPE